MFHQMYPFAIVGPPTRTPSAPADCVPTTVPSVDGVARTLRLDVVSIRSPTLNDATVGSVVALMLTLCAEVFPAASKAETV